MGNLNLDFGPLYRSQQLMRIRISDAFKFLVHYVKTHFKFDTVFVANVQRDLSRVEDTCNFSSD